MTFNDFPAIVMAANKTRLVNQFWKLIPMRENDEDWKAHLDALIEEVSGLNAIFAGDLDFLVLLSKMEGLRSPICEDFKLYRKTVFRCINLITRLFDLYGQQS